MPIMQTTLSILVVDLYIRCYFVQRIFSFDLRMEVGISIATVIGQNELMMGFEEALSDEE